MSFGRLGTNCLIPKLHKFSFNYKNPLTLRRAPYVPGRGSPSALTQVMLGAGIPVAWHNKLADCPASSCTTASILLVMVGGTAKQTFTVKIKIKKKRKKKIYSSVFIENRCPSTPKPVYGGKFSHKAVTLKIRSRSPKSDKLLILSYL